MRCGAVPNRQGKPASLWSDWGKAQQREQLTALARIKDTKATSTEGM